jgi:ABC-type Fe3+ transport system substrate-binding protein
VEVTVVGSSTLMRSVSILAACVTLAVACAPPTGAPAPGQAPDTGGEKPAWQVEWERVLAEARREGEVIVWGDAGDDAREHQKDAFERAYPGIRVTLFQATSSTERDSRLLQELDAGVAKLDIMIAGSAGANARVKPAGGLQDARPMQILPEVFDPQKWLDGKLTWVDEEEKYILMGDAFVTPALAVNKSVNPSEIQSWWDLLDPKWRGKIVMTDPRQSGAGFARGVFFFNTPELGPDFMRRFFSETGIIFSQDERQNLEWAISGRVLATISPNPFEIVESQKLGLEFGLIPTLRVNATKVADSYSGSQGIAMVPNVDPLPHPNAAKVYYNWFYSQQGMQALQDIRSRTSRRLDVDKSKLPEFIVPKPGVEYLNLNNPQATATETVQAMRDVVNSALPR